MAGGDDSVMWLRVKDEDIDAAELLRVKVITTGSGKKRWFVCTGTLYKGKDNHMREYSRAQKKVKADPRNDEQLKCSEGCMSGAFHTALSDVHALTKHLLCDRVDVPELTRAGANKPFWTYTQACLISTCSAPVLGRLCGWDDKAPKCPVLVSNLRYA